MALYLYIIMYFLGLLGSCAFYRMRYRLPTYRNRNIENKIGLNIKRVIGDKLDRFTEPIKNRRKATAPCCG